MSVVNRAHYRLTPADVADLRASVSGPTRAMGGFVRLPVPHVIFTPADNRFALLRDGHLLATHPRVEVLGELMRAERQEPGFIARVLSPAEDPERALDDHATRLQRQSRLESASTVPQSASTVPQGVTDADRERWARERLKHFDPRHITLDDL